MNLHAVAIMKCTERLADSMLRKAGVWETFMSPDYRIL